MSGTPFWNTSGKKVPRAVVVSHVRSSGGQERGQRPTQRRHERSVTAPSDVSTPVRKLRRGGVVGHSTCVGSAAWPWSSSPRTSTTSCGSSPTGCCRRRVSSPARARPASPTTSTACSARSTSTRRGSSRAVRSRAVTAGSAGSSGSCRCRGSRSSRGARASRVRAACRSASSTVRCAAGRRSTATASPRSATISTVDATQDRELQAAAVRARVRGVYGPPEYGGNRGLAGWRAIGFAGDVQPRGYTDAEVTGCLTFDAVVVGTGPAGATAADVLTGAGWSVVHAREGPQPPARARCRRSTGSATCRTTRSSSSAATSSVPIRCSSRAPTGARRPTATRSFAGEVNNLPSTVGGGGFHADGKLPRFREVDFRLASELGPIEGADIVDWPLDYDEMEPYYAEAERVDRRGRRPHRQPVRGVAQRSVPDAAGRRHVRRDPDRDRGRERSATTRTARRPA